jgi:hypothetical protein
MAVFKKRLIILHRKIQVISTVICSNMKFSCSIFVFICSAIDCFSQTEYAAGTSSVSLEPDSSIFSVALAGYGIPREGRFSITWNKVADSKNSVAITSLQNKFYSVDQNHVLWQGSFINGELQWKKISEDENIRCLTSFEGKLLAVKENKLFQGTISASEVSWTPLSGLADINTITALKGKLYATNPKDDLLAGTLSKNKISWTKIGKATGIASVTSQGEQIFAINSGDTIWRIKPYFPNPYWMEIGRKNNETVDIDIEQLVVCGNALYAVASDKQLYKATHKTDGNLTARAVAIRNKKQTVVIVALDVTGFDLSFTNEIKSAILKSKKIPASAILINASHTHFAPVTQAWITWGAFYQVPDSNYLNKIVKKAVIHCIEEAVDNLKPAEVHFGRSSSIIGRNRRGTEQKYKPYDSTLDIITIQNLKHQIQSIIFLTGCHPVQQLKGEEAYTLSANFPAKARSKIEQALQIPHTIFIQGCGGDINPKSTNHTETGEQLADDVIRLAYSTMETVKGSISFAMDRIDIPITPWPKDSVLTFKATNEASPGDLLAEKNVRWANLMLSRYEKGTLAKSLPVYVQTINIGNWKLVGLSREVVNEYGPAIRQLFPDKNVSVAGYSNDVASYLPNSWHLKEKQYEGYESFLWYGQPGLPPLNVLQLIVEKIKLFNR